MSPHRNTAIRAFALGVITGSFATAGGIMLAGPAHADPGDPSPALIRDAIQAEPYVCQSLAADPTVSTLRDVLTTVQIADGLTAGDTGTVVALAVYDGCPKYVPILERFVALYAPTPSGTVA